MIIRDFFLFIICFLFTFLQIGLFFFFFVNAKLLNLKDNLALHAAIMAR